MRDGNIGGLLARTTGGTNYFYHYDGSGNVTQLTKADKSNVAQYEYDAYGVLTSSSGTQANENPYRYQAKEVHTRSGLVDFGYRFYSPGLGRWINRDPIEEDGGLNLYNYVGNDPVNAWDEYGLSTATKPATDAAWEAFVRGANAVKSGAGYGASFVGSVFVGAVGFLLMDAKPLGDGTLKKGVAGPLKPIGKQPKKGEEHHPRSSASKEKANDGARSTNKICETATGKKAYHALAPNHKKGYHKAIGILKRGEAGYHQHELTDDLAGKMGMDLPNSANGRGGLRIIFSKKNGVVTIHDIRD